MANFTYKAKDSSGRTIDGSVEAPDSRGAADKIREMGYWPLDVRMDGAPAKLQSSSADRSLSIGTNPVWTGVSARSLAVFFRQMATMLGAGMILSEALDSLGRQGGIGKLSAVARRGAEHVRSGGMFSDVMTANRFIFTQAQIGLLKAGETGGMLEGMVDRIATYQEHDLELRHKLARVTFYPKLLVGFVLLFNMFFPYIVQMVIGNAVPALLTVLRNSILPLAFEVLAIYVFVKLMLAIPPLRQGWDFFKITIPVVGTASKKLAMARFSASLSVMYSAGVPFGQALEVAASASGNESIRRSITSAIPQVQAGGSVTEALQRTGRIPDMVLGMLSTGERTGNLTGTLDKVAEYYEDEATSTFEKMGYVLFAVAILVIGISVAVRIILPFWMGVAVRSTGGGL